MKTVALTDRGVRTRQRLSAAMLGPPDELLAMDLRSLETLREQLEKLPSSSEPIWWMPAGPGSGEPRGEAASH